MKRYTIAITGLDVSCEVTAARHILLSLKSSPMFSESRIIVINYSLGASSNFDTDGIDAAYFVHSPLVDPKKFETDMIYVLRKENIDILLPTMALEGPVFFDLQKLLEEKNLNVLIPSLKNYFFFEKEKLFKFCSKQNIYMPLTIPVYSYYTIYEYALSFIYPMILKNTKGQEIPCYDLPEIYTCYSQLLRECRSSIYLQYSVPGESYSVVILMNGVLPIGRVLAKRVIYTPQGETWSALTVTNPDLLNISNEILFKLNLNFSGPLEMRFQRPFGTNRFYLTDLSARFPDWIHLATVAGQNLVEQYMKMLLGMKVEENSFYQPGMMMVKS